MEDSLLETVSFMKSRDLIHFDAHFENILTDGQNLYFSDFGLATSTQFELSGTEEIFFGKHYYYDQCYTMAFLVKWILIELFGFENYDDVLNEYGTGKGRGNLSLKAKELIARYSPIEIILNKFYTELRKDKTTNYPVHELKIACIAAKL